MDPFSAELPLSWTAISARLGLALILGAAFGLDRELRDVPAGLRTHILVALASSAFAVASLEAVSIEPFSRDTVRLDTLRVIEAVTAGVAFLAAGTIIRGRRSVHGLTTGATLWLCGAVGLSAGLGLWRLAVMATVLGLFVLVGLGALERGWTKPPAGTGPDTSR